MPETASAQSRSRLIKLVSKMLKDGKTMSEIKRELPAVARELTAKDLASARSAAGGEAIAGSAEQMSDRFAQERELAEAGAAPRPMRRGQKVEEEEEK